MCRKSSFRLRAGALYVPEKLFSSAGWQPARRDVAKEFVSSAGWQPARRDVAKEFVSSAGGQPAEDLICAGKALFVCGLAARRGLMCRKSSFRLRAGALYVPEKLFSSAGWQPARRDVAKEFVSSAGWQPAEALYVPEKLFSFAGWQPAEALCAGKALFVCGLAARRGPICAGKALFVCGLAARTA